MAPKQVVYVVHEKSEPDVVGIVHAFDNREAAKAELHMLKTRHVPNMEISELEVKSRADSASPESKGQDIDRTIAHMNHANTSISSANSKVKGSKNAKSAVTVDDEDMEDDDQTAREESPKKKKSKPLVDESKIPNGTPNALHGLKLLFTGTLDMNRETCKAAAEQYGAKVITKLENTDYIIVGSKPGPKKLEEIGGLDVDTISEDDFYTLVQSGVPQHKRDRMALKAAAKEAEKAEAGEPAKKKQKKSP